MKLYTILSDINQEKNLFQVQAQTAEEATKEAIKHLPHFDELELSEQDFEIISNIMEEKTIPSLLKVDHCKNTWLWKEGLSLNNKIISYVFKTNED